MYEDCIELNILFDVIYLLYFISYRADIFNCLYVERDPIKNPCNPYTVFVHQYDTVTL